MTKTDKLASIQKVVSRCRKCHELCSGRTQTVFGRGKPDAKILCVGEAPGAEEDKQGLPFVGASGRLMDEILKAAGWLNDVYICNIVKCRPPENRKPEKAEADACAGFLKLQIETVDPDWIICWGQIAAYYLLRPDKPIEKFKVGSYRNNIFKYGRAGVVVTFHPAYALRNGLEAKKAIWEDMLALKKLMASGKTVDELIALASKPSVYKVD